MKHQVIEQFSPQINEIELILEREFKLKTGSVLDYVSIKNGSPLENYLPAILVLLFGNSKKDSFNKIIPMASVAQFIYFGTMVHLKVDDHNEENTQFPILIGDYLYGKFFVALCNVGCLEFLPGLSNAIKSIHEASAEENELSFSSLDKNKISNIYEKKWGEFFGLCCKIGTTIVNKPANQSEYAFQLGKALGRFYGTVHSTYTDNLLFNEVKADLLSLINKMNDSFIKQNLVSILEKLSDDYISDSNMKSVLVG